MIKVAGILFFVFTCFSNGFGQEKINWIVDFDKENKEVVIKAKLIDGWHIYSQFLDEDAGPIPTSIKFESNKKIKISDKTQEPKGKKIFDKNFNSELIYFEDEVTFTTNVLKIKDNTTLKGSVLFMLCDDEGCLPPDEFKFELDIFK